MRTPLADVLPNVAGIDLLHISELVIPATIVIIGAGLAVNRLAAGRSIGLILKLSAGVTIVASLAAVGVISVIMLTPGDRDVMLELLLIAAIAGFAGAMFVSRTHERLERSRSRERALEASRRELGAAAERERIARELHDVIAHGLSVMVIQAQGAGSALRQGHSSLAGEAMNAVVVTGRGALAETRRLLGAVRREDADLAPMPALGDLPALVASVRQAGTPVRLEITGAERPLPAGVELSAFRIIQEALTNTMKHAGPGATATVSVRYAGDGLELDITDTGSGPADHSAVIPAGHGLAGMRARVALLGGELWAGAVPGGGFGVRARLEYGSPVMEDS